MSLDRKLGFIGAGNMAEAIAQAAVSSGLHQPGELIAADPSEDRRALFNDKGIETTADAGEVIARARMIVLAVKPQVFPEVAEQLKAVDADAQVLVSIMAGLSTGRIASAAGKDVAVVRVMPNTPLLAGAGMAGVAPGEFATADQAEQVKALFSSAGEAVVIDESQMDALTSVSGSGPAYLFYLAEAMEAAATEQGLGEHARLLVSQTLFGAAKLLKGSNEDPAELRRRVTSKGGTTLAATTHMDQNKMNRIIVNAVKAAAQRSKELGG